MRSRISRSARYTETRQLANWFRSASHHAGLSRRTTNPIGGPASRQPTIQYGMLSLWYRSLNWTPPPPSLSTSSSMRTSAASSNPDNWQKVSASRPLANWLVHLDRSEEHTFELQSLTNLVCRLLLEKKKKKQKNRHRTTTVTLSSARRL